MSIFVIGTSATYQAVPVAADADARLAQLQKAVACADQTSGYIEGVPHTGDRDDVVTMYCNEEAGMIENAGFNDLGAALISVLGYNIAAFFPLAVRGPLVITGFTDEEGTDVPLTEEQSKALVAVCDYIKKRDGDLSAAQVRTAKMLGLCLFRGDTKKQIIAADAKAKAKKAKSQSSGAGAGAGAGAGSKPVPAGAGGGKQEHKKA